MYMLEYNFDSDFEESARLDIFRVYYRTRQTTNTTFERRFDDAPTEFVPDAHMHESSQISSDSRVARYMRLIIVYYWLIVAALLLQWFYKFVALLFPGAVLIYSTNRIASSIKSCFMSSLALSNWLMTLFD